MTYLLSVGEIRSKYPNPTTPTGCEGSNKYYCVGGAFILAHPDAKKLAKMIEVDDMNFPADTELSRILKFFYPEAKNIPQKCKSIINSNDDGKFEQAWNTLGSLIDY